MPSEEVASHRLRGSVCKRLCLNPIPARRTCHEPITPSELDLQSEGEKARPPVTTINANTVLAISDKACRFLEQLVGGTVHDAFRHDSRIDSVFCMIVGESL
jgi:hypothetical protein